MRSALRSATAAAALAAMLVAGPAAGATPPVTVVAVLPLSPVDTGMPYAVLPVANQLDEMTARLRQPFTKTPNTTVVPLAAVERALRSAGFYQASALRACATPECGQRIGKLVGATRVVMGGVTREMGVVWSTDASIVDVRTGRVVGELRAGYKGDVKSMVVGETTLGGCLLRVMDHRAPCKDDPGY